MGILEKFFQPDSPAETKKDKSQAPRPVSEKQATLTKATPSARKSRVAARIAGHTGVLLRAVITEKASVLASQRQYVFAVRPEATKHTIATAVESGYGVRPVAVKVAMMPAKVRRRRGVTGQVAAWKKAIVTLPEGKSITIAEGV